MAKPLFVVREEIQAATKHVSSPSPRDHKDNEWPDPEPLAKPSDPLPYPINALPGEIRAAVSEVLDFVQCPQSLAACSALSSLSLAGQGLANVRRDERLTGPISLYLLAISGSGERKTTVDGFFLESLRGWEKEKEIEADPSIKEFKAEHDAWESERAGILAQIKEYSKSGKDPGELRAKLVQLQQQEPESPRYPQVIYGDSTPEALSWSLTHRWPSGAVISSEAGIVFGGHANGKDSIVRNLSLLNQLWDGISLRIDRRTSESYTVRGVRMSMGLATQHETIQLFYEASRGLARGSGFSARFLLAWPESTQGTRLYKPAPPSWPHLTQYQNRLIELLEKTPFPDGENGLELPTLDLSPEGRVVWINLYNEIERSLAPGKEMAEAKDVASKSADNIARLAALFTLYLGLTEITADTIERASRIVIWHMNEAKRFFAEIQTNPEDLLVVKLDQWLLEQGKPRIPKNDIRRLGPNPLRKGEVLDSTLTELIEAGRVRLIKADKKVFVEIHPALFQEKA